jgi:hypothetical protein
MNLKIRKFGDLKILKPAKSTQFSVADSKIISKANVKSIARLQVILTFQCPPAGGRLKVRALTLKRAKHFQSS